MTKSSIIILTSVLSLSAATAASAQTERHLLKANDFDELYIKGACRVDLREVADSTGMIVITADHSAYDAIEKQHAGQSLYISVAQGARPISRGGRIPVIVYCPRNMKAISLSGNGAIEGSGIVADDELALIVSGPGTIKLSDCSAQNINVTITGSGKIELGTGVTASNINCSLTGSGHIYADRLTATTLSGTVRGSGGISVSGSSPKSSFVMNGSGTIDLSGLVSSDLKLNLYGEGEIRYSTGTPVKSTGNVKNIKAVKTYNPR